ncbi:hypothetical protein TNCV_4693611 [Trichonephila clavipes]|uniref:Uncharacterized protein n=1 Tax=Trichonephila clavipes TaxID=2585209 RepID=A0A8X7BIE4_TRICX|nr:hypothetical protein TNCV_4693611 [Trichonephila clavipes]
MVPLRSHLNTMKPSDIIVLESTVDLVEKIHQLFQVLTSGTFLRLSLMRTWNLQTFSKVTWNRRPAKEREPLSKPCGL